MVTDDERRKILEMIEQGQITAQDGIDLLNALNGEVDAEAASLTGADFEDDFDFEIEQDVLSEFSAGDQEGDPGWGPPQEYRPDTPPDLSPGEPQDLPPHASPEAPPSAFEGEPEVIQPEEPFDPSKLKYSRFWQVPLWVGVGVTLVGALLMYAAWNAGGLGFWFACSWFPFMIGVAVIALAWASRTARWIHVRVHQKPGEKPERIAISLPIPLRLTAWFLRTFGHHIPQLGDTSLDEVVIALENTSPETPFFVEVNEGNNGERVEVYIG